MVVFVHELGHYLAARASGVRVEAFAIGFKPVLRWKDKRGCEWRLGWVPFGGYCQLYGQEDMFDRAKYNKMTAAQKRGHYLSVSGWKQALILVAGVAMNFILAWAIYTTMFVVKERQIQSPVVGQVIRDSAAYNAGVRAGDRVLRIDGEKIGNWGELVIAKDLAGGDDATVILLRGEKLITVQLEPADRWGMVADGTKTFQQRKNIVQAAWSGAREVWVQSKTLVVVLKQIITGERSSKQLGSFITIAQVSGQALSAGIFALLSIIALLSVNLGIVNLLPLPVLDGGYLLILGTESVIRRRLQGKMMERILVGGWILIGAIFVLTMWNDIARVFKL
jgi:regulator of sigma E protease